MRISTIPQVLVQWFVFTAAFAGDEVDISAGSGHAAIDGNMCTHHSLAEKTPGDAVPDRIDDLVAFPRAAGCRGLVLEKDFFSQDVYGRDPHFLPALRNVSALLDGISDPAALEPSLGISAAVGLLRRKMSALTGIHLSSQQPPDRDRYDVSFHLRDINTIVVLSIDDNGENAEWGELLE